MKLNMKTKLFRKFLPLFALLVLLVGVLACNYTNLANPEPPREPHPGEEEPGEGEPYPQEGQPEHEGEQPPDEVWIEFEAERTHIAPGECTLLFWHVEGGGFGVFLNGEPVERMGEREICLQEPEMFVLAVDMGEEMQERAIEIQTEGEPPEGEPPHEGEPPPEGEPPQEGEPPPESDPPPEEPGMSDEEAIKQALLTYLGWNESELEFTMGENRGDVANGGVKKVGEMSGAGWFAGKDSGGQWKIAFVGQGLPYCSEIQPFNFPTDWLSHCLDGSGNTVER